MESILFDSIIEFVHGGSAFLFDFSEAFQPLLAVTKLYKDILSQNPQYYGMGLGEISESHKLLVQVIAMIIVFETVRRNQRHKSANLECYRIPFDDGEKLYHNFSSLSSKARKSMVSVYNYLEKRQNKQPFFAISPTDKYYCEFAIKFCR